ncbi:ATP-binding protein [Dermabacteraceae bacterium CCM 9520]
MKEKIEIRDAHKILFRVLTGESMLLSVVVGQDPEEVLKKMLHGVDIDKHPAWRSECEDRRELLEDFTMGERLFFLCVPLGKKFSLERVKGAASAWMERRRLQLGLPLLGISRDEKEACLRQAKTIEGFIPSIFKPKRVTLAQQIWLEGHLVSRGALFDVFPNSENPGPEDVTRWLGQPVIDEGGKSDIKKGFLGSTNPNLRNPFLQRYLKIGSEDQFALGEASYQSMFALTGFPAEGLAWPGSELLGDIDNYAPGAEWVIRMNTISSHEAKKANRKAARTINDQLDQRDSEVGTGHHDLDTSIDLLREYDQILTNNRNEVEIQPVIVFAIYSNDPEDITSRLSYTIKEFRDLGFDVACPVGYQEKFWWAFVPGAYGNSLLNVFQQAPVNEFRQVATSSVMSALIPMASGYVGDDSGPVIAVNESNGLPSLVHLNLEHAVSVRNMSACVGVTGDLGSGKSSTMKTIVKYVSDRGGQVFGTDRSKRNEWGQFISTLPNSIVVDPMDPHYSLDPLRMFTGEHEDAGSRVASNFFISLLDVSPTEELGDCLAECLLSSYRKENQIKSLVGLLAHLRRRGESGDENAALLAKKMGIFAKQDFGRCLFNEELQPLPWDSASAMVVRTDSLEVPTSDELEKPHLFKRMRAEKIFGMAFYILLTALARTICFASSDRFALYFEDEAHMVTRNDMSRSELTLFVRDGRKHGAAFLVGSHDPLADFGDETMRSLIPIRIVHRQKDKNLAKRSIEWLLGEAPEDETLADQLVNDTSPQIGGEVPEDRRGEAFMKDASGAVGRVRILIPANKRSREAVSTTPEMNKHD